MSQNVYSWKGILYSFQKLCEGWDVEAQEFIVLDRQTLGPCRRRGFWYASKYTRKSFLIGKKWWNWLCPSYKRHWCGYTEKSKVILNSSNCIFQMKTPRLYWSWSTKTESLNRSKYLSSRSTYDHWLLYLRFFAEVCIKTVKMEFPNIYLIS